MANRNHTTPSSVLEACTYIKRGCMYLVWR